MEMSVLHAAGSAFLAVMEPHRLLVLGFGVVIGLALGILPGVGTLAGVAILLPFTLNLDTYTAFALLLGLASVTATGDPIPAILFGVPGGAGSAATVLDGQPMARKGEAGRALSAAYMASMLGGLCGAAIMFASIPVLRPLILSVGAPQLLAFATFGISMVAILSGNAPLKGLAAGCLGIMLSFVGSNPQTGELRYTFNSLYLLDGLPLVALVLGVYALPEICDLMISRGTVTTTTEYKINTGRWRGAVDCFRNWWLITRCSAAGAALCTIPGITGAVIDWLMYGYALNSEKGARETFGKGDVRGVIAVECSNNAKEAGQLIPAVAFGVPGTASMAILIGAFYSRGLVPGPEMLTKHLDVTYSMVWSMALANVLGAGICYMFSSQFAKLAVMRYTLILPTILGIIYIAAFENSRQWGDLYSLLLFGLLGWTMKQLKWARPPLILGFVLGVMIERYLFISVQRYGFTWVKNPVVLVLFAIALYTLIRPLIREFRSQGRLAMRIGTPHFSVEQLFHVVILVILGYMVIEARGWQPASRTVPMTVGTLGIFFTGFSLLSSLFLREGEAATQSGSIHMDLASDTAHLPVRTVLLRSAIFFGWLVALMVSMAVIGFMPSVPLFVIAFMRFENREPWKLVLPQAIGLTLFLYYVFDKALGIPWPPTLLGYLVPALHAIPSV